MAHDQDLIDEENFKDLAREALRAEFPNISEVQVETIVAARLKGFRTRDIDVSSNLKTIDFGMPGGPQLSGTYKNLILKD
jgi:hypothetical protein